MVDRRFWIADGRRVEFETAFEFGGGWSTLLSCADGYLKTEMWLESPELPQYRVRDFWSWHRNFEIFRSRFQAELERFEEWLRLEKIVEREQFLGAYYEKREDDDEDFGFELEARS